MDSALKHQDLNLKWSCGEVQRIASHCNDRKLAAKTISDKSAELFLCLFIRQCGPIVVDAVGMISHKRSLRTIFGHKHKIKNFIKKFDNFHKKIQRPSILVLFETKNANFEAKLYNKNEQ